MVVIKRNGVEAPFNIQKIVIAIQNANKEVSEADQLTENQITEIANKVWVRCNKFNRPIPIDTISSFVEDELIKARQAATAKAYIKYHYQKDVIRRKNTTDDLILSTVELKNQDVLEENSNKNPIVASTQRDYIAGISSKDLVERYLLPKEIVEAHKQGVIHFHDQDYFVQKIHNCCLWNLDDMLQNGTVINGVRIEKPHSFMTACTVATQIMAIIASNQYGGQTMSLTHLAPFVDISRQRIYQEVVDELTEERVDTTSVNHTRFKRELMVPERCIGEIVERRLAEEIRKGVQTIQYQILTISSTNGQTPFVTLNMYLNEAKTPGLKADLALIIEEVLQQRIQGVKNEKGVWVTPAFPKLVYVLEEDNVTKGTPYWYLTELAAKCTAKRMVPDYVSEKIMKQNKINAQGGGDCYPPMGCRSFLTPDRTFEMGNIANAGNYVEGEPKYYGRFNQGVVTINLVDVACSSKKNVDKFWKILDERLALCHKALQIRHNRLKGTPSDVAPLLWQHGALARLKKGETIDKLLYGGYSTLSLGYAGLWETVYYMTGKKLTEEEGKVFGLAIMQKLNEYTGAWKKAENIDYSLYGTPLESTTYKFAKCLQERFGLITGVTDKNYVTNSYHVHVTEPIDAFSKLQLESEFQLLSPGGAISYVEVPNLQHNIEAVLSIMQFIYDNIIYAELNTKSDYCMKCGYDGEIEIVENEDHKLVWECPNCKNRDQNQMSVVRRTCGYLGSNFWNQGRTQEIKERVLHL